MEAEEMFDVPLGETISAGPALRIEMNLEGKRGRGGVMYLRARLADQEDSPEVNLRDYIGDLTDEAQVRGVKDALVVEAAQALAWMST